MHGGALPQVKKAAKERLLELVDPALASLHKVLTNPDADDGTKVRAALGILDRTGFKPGMTIQVEVTKFDEVLEQAVTIDRGLPTPNSEEPAALEAGWEDVDQIVRSAQDDIDRERHDEETREYLAGRIFPDENTVPGEVLFPPPPPGAPAEYGDRDGYLYPRRPQ
jgi:hypothetical protein